MGEARESAAREVLARHVKANVRDLDFVLNGERDAVIAAMLEFADHDREACDYRHAQDNARDTGDKLYRMGQKDAAIFLAAAIRNTDFTKGEEG